MMASVYLTEAKYITMETEVTAGIEVDTAKIHVGVTNKGDEPAYNIRVSTDVSGKVTSAPLREILKPNDQYSQDLTAVLEYKKPGRYPAIIIVDYTDKNQYPFTAISIAYLNYKESVVGRAVGEVIPSVMSDKGTLKVKVKNLEESDERIEVSLVLPKELKSPNPKKEVSLKPGKEDTLLFDITNISALPGSSYQVYALFGYEHDQYYYSNAIGGNIKVEQRKSLLEQYQTPLIAIAVTLILIVAYFSGRRRKS